MELDFSKLENLAYRGFEGEKARAEKDKLIERGFVVIEGTTTPFEAPPQQNRNISACLSRGPLERKIEPFTGIDKKRDYRAMYRAAFAYHERHTPPRVDVDYWHTHTPGVDEPPRAELAYWAEVASDAAATASAHQNDPFLMDLLVTVYTELENEYRKAVILK